jgi:hypothetical protein
VFFFFAGEDGSFEGGGAFIGYWIGIGLYWIVLDCIGLGISWYWVGFGSDWIGLQSSTTQLGFSFFSYHDWILYR